MTRQRRLTSRYWKTAGSGLALIAIVCLSGGCVRADAEFTFSKDDTYSADLRFEIGQAELAEYSFSANAAEDPQVQIQTELNMVARQLTGTSGKSQSEATDGDGFVGHAISVTGGTLADWPDRFGPAELAVSHENGWFKVAGHVDLSAMTESLDLFEDAGQPEMTLRLSFPGQVQSTNGQANGDTAVFNLKAGQDNPIEVVAADSKGGQLRLAIAVVSGLVTGALAIVAGLWLLRRRDRRLKMAMPLPGSGAANPAGSENWHE
jgi:hypothetical protein